MKAIALVVAYVLFAPALVVLLGYLVRSAVDTFCDKGIFTGEKVFFIVIYYIFAMILALIVVGMTFGLLKCLSVI